jgi:hypothetical protein
VEWDDGNEAVHTREDCPGTAVQRLYLVKKIKSECNIEDTNNHSLTLSRE